jgi:hypothetical protein
MPQIKGSVIYAAQEKETARVNKKLIEKIKESGKNSTHYILAYYAIILIITIVFIVILTLLNDKATPGLAPCKTICYAYIAFLLNALYIYLAHYFGNQALTIYGFGRTMFCIFISIAFSLAFFLLGALFFFAVRGNPDFSYCLIIYLSLLLATFLLVILGAAGIGIFKALALPKLSEAEADRKDKKPKNNSPETQSNTGNESKSSSTEDPHETNSNPENKTDECEPESPPNTDGQE